MMRSFFLCLLSILPLSAFAGNSCNESVSAATLSEDGQTLYIGLTRGAVHQVNLQTLEIDILHNPGGSYYNCIHAMRLIDEGRALFVGTSADLGIHFDLQTGAVTSMEFAEAWAFSIEQAGLDSAGALWVVGSQPNLRERIVCEIGESFICRESDESLPALIPLTTIGRSVRSYEIDSPAAAELLTPDYRADLRIDGRLQIERNGAQETYMIARSDGDTFIGYAGELEGPIPFASLSAGNDHTLLLGEASGVVHIIDLNAQRRRTLSCGTFYNPREICAVVYNGPLTR